MKGIVYDAAAVARVLGWDLRWREPAPQAEPGEIVCFYDGSTLSDMLKCKAGHERMWKDPLVDDWPGWSAPAGYYQFIPLVPESCPRRYDEQCALLLRHGASWEPAPICVAATALLMHLVMTGEDLLQGAGCRCAETFSGTNSVPGSKLPPVMVRAGLHIHKDQIHVMGVRDGYSLPSIWLAAARKV